MAGEIPPQFIPSALLKMNTPKRNHGLEPGKTTHIWDLAGWSTWITHILILVTPQKWREIQVDPLNPYFEPGFFPFTSILAYGQLLLKVHRAGDHLHQDLGGSEPWCWNIYQ